MIDITTLGMFCPFLSLLTFIGGIMIGSVMKDHQWREKARDGFRMASGNALYEVRKVFDFAGMEEPTP